MDIKKLWPSIAGLLGLLLTVFADPINAWVLAHPVESLAGYQVITLIANVINPQKVPS